MHENGMKLWHGSIWFHACICVESHVGWDLRVHASNLHMVCNLQTVCCTATAKTGVFVMPTRLVCVSLGSRVPSATDTVTPPTSDSGAERSVNARTGESVTPSLGHAHVPMGSMAAGLH